MGQVGSGRISFLFVVSRVWLGSTEFTWKTTVKTRVRAYNVCSLCNVRPSVCVYRMQLSQLVDRASSHYRQHCLTNTEQFLHTVKDWYRYTVYLHLSSSSASSTRIQIIFHQCFGMWLGDVMVRASDWLFRGRRFDSRSYHCHVTILGN